MNLGYFRIKQGRRVFHASLVFNNLKKKPKQSKNALNAIERVHPLQQPHPAVLLLLSTPFQQTWFTTMTTFKLNVSFLPSAFNDVRIKSYHMLYMQKSIFRRVSFAFRGGANFFFFCKQKKKTPPPTLPM